MVYDLSVLSAEEPSQEAEWAEQIRLFADALRDIQGAIEDEMHVDVDAFTIAGIIMFTYAAMDMELDPRFMSSAIVEGVRLVNEYAAEGEDDEGE